MPAEVKNPDLLPLFEEAKVLLAPYAAQFTVTVDEPGRYELWSEREVVVEGRKRDRVFFASLIVQKAFVGFYYMPIYAEAGLAEFFGPELLATLKGKSCFHLKRLTPELKAQIEDALAKGLALYRERGWAA